MSNFKIDKFLEDNNMIYMFLLLANLETERLGNLPYTVKKKLTGKVTSKALEHIATNDIPDYIIKDMKKEVEEAKKEE